MLVIYFLGYNEIVCLFIKSHVLFKWERLLSCCFDYIKTRRVRIWIWIVLLSFRVPITSLTKGVKGIECNLINCVSLWKWESKKCVIIYSLKSLWQLSSHNFYHSSFHFVFLVGFENIKIFRWTKNKFKSNIHPIHVPIYFQRNIFP